MDLFRSPNVVLGWSFSAVAIAAISILIWAYTTFAPPEDLPKTVCELPVSIEENGKVRLGCVSDDELAACGELEAGDHIRLRASQCDVVAGGMESSFRLASNLPVDLNRASLDDLQFLEGVGPVLARAVLRYREVNGPFQNLDALLNVRGIGPKTLERLRSRLTVSNRALPMKE